MYVYNIEFENIMENEGKSDTIMVWSENEYSQDEFKNIIKSIIDETVKEKRYLDQSDWITKLKSIGFDIFNFTVSVYFRYDEFKGETRHDCWGLQH